MTDSGLPDHLKRMYARMNETAKSVRKELTATEFRQNATFYAAGTLTALIISHAFPSTAEVMLRSLASSNPEVKEFLNFYMILIIGQGLAAAALFYIPYIIYSKGSEIWKFAVAAYHLALIGFALPAIVWLHIGFNDILWTPWGVVEGIPEWPALIYFAVLGIDKVYHEVKKRYYD